MDISVLVVTYNSSAYIAECLGSAFKQTGIQFEVIVVDNASTDDTLARLKGLDVQLITSKENLGFGRGVNLGFTSTTGRYIYLLNPDAWLLDTSALANLCRAMDSHPQWGMAGHKVLSADGTEESPPAAEYPAQRHVHRDFSKLPGKIAWVSACMVVRRDVFEKLGGFDPEIFLYSEETDLCLRVRETGFEVGYVPEVAVSHIGGASEDPRDPYIVSSRKLRGLLRFRQKHYPQADCVFLARRDLRRAKFRMAWNGLLARFQPPNSKAWRKYRQYSAIWEISREYLSAIK